MRYFLFFTLLLASCATLTPQNGFRTKGLVYNDILKGRAAIIQPLEVSIKGIGLQSSISHATKKEILNVIEDNAKSIFKDSVFGVTLISGAERNNLLFKNDKDKKFLRVISRDRSIVDTLGYVLDSNEKVILKEFSQKSELPIVVVPVKVSVVRTISGQERDEVKITYKQLINYQIWDISIQEMLFDGVENNSFSYSIEKTDMENLEKFQEFSYKEFEKLVLNIKYGDIK